VASSATLNAGRDVAVLASNQTTTQAIAVGAAVSGGVSLGGGLAIAQVNDRTLATLAGNTTAGRNVGVRALDSQGNTPSTLRTYAGGAGLAGLAASYAWHDKSSKAQAQLGGTLVTNGTVTVDAALHTDLMANGGAAAMGVVGVGAAIGLAASGGSATHAAVVMAIFSLGAVLPLMLVGFLGRGLLQRNRQRLTRVGEVGRQLMGASLLVVGILVLTGFDKMLEAWLLGLTPDWLVALTTRY
jgi:hypothetical protein